MTSIFKPIALSLACCGVLAAETAMFRGDPAHSGVYDASGAPGLATVKWKFKTARGIFSSPAVAGGSVYFGSADHNLYAVNAVDGSLRWKFPTGGPVNSSPAIEDGAVYAGSLDGNFYAVDAETGKLKWKFKTGGERRFSAPGIHGAMPRTEVMPDPFDVFLSSPAIAGGVVYFGSGDHNVYALDARSGELKWKFTTGNVIHASPAIEGGTLYIGSWDRYLYALDARTGSLRWKFETGDDTQIYNQIGIASSAAVAGGVVYFGCRDGHFYAVDAKSGVEKWKHDNHMGWVIASPAVLNGVVYFPTSEGTRFKAIEGATGRLIFSIENKAISFSSPAIAKDIAYFGSSDGWLHAVDLKTGKMQSEFQTEGSKQNAAKYSDAQGKMDPGKLYPDATLDGMIVGNDRMFTLGSVISSPVVAEGVVYFGSTDGYLYAVM
ncbi:MAG: PQQ-binding-like beta-propeller repeat protein [Candidatus Solibacter usitatus]|nr:PQQ-binding-like beta-propeller repeat protein [Candidatus Solibacter usitatus]